MKTHNKIHKYVMNGYFNIDQDMIHVRQEYERFLIDWMKCDGRVPVDLDSAFATSYDDKKKVMEFQITMHGH